MSKKKVDTQTRQDILQRAWRVAEPDEIDRLVRQAGRDGTLKRELRSVKRQLVKERARAEKAEAKLRKREAKRKYEKPTVGKKRSRSCTGYGDGPRPEPGKNRGYPEDYRPIGGWSISLDQ